MSPPTSTTRVVLGGDRYRRGDCAVVLPKISICPSFLPQRCRVCRLWIRGSLPFHYSKVHFHQELQRLSADSPSCPHCSYAGAELALHLGVVHSYYESFLSRVFSCAVVLDRRPFMEHASSCSVKMDDSDIAQYLKLLRKEEEMPPREEDFKLLIQCRLCSESFSNLYHLLLHLVEELRSTFPASSSPTEGSAICHECSTEVPLDSLLEHHGVFHQAVIRPYVLEVNKSSSNTTFFSRAEEGGYACSLCEASLLTEMLALSHIMEAHDPLIYCPMNCLLCERLVRSNFIDHVMEEHFAEDISGILPACPPFSCYVCQIVCKSVKELTHHFCYIHNMALNLYNNAVNSSSKNKHSTSVVKFVYRCWFCEYEDDFFTNTDDLRAHVIEVHLLGPLEVYVTTEVLGDSSRRECRDCLFLGRDEQDLLCHILSIHSQYLDAVLERLGAEEMLESLPISEELPPQSKIVREALLRQMLGGSHGASVEDGDVEMSSGEPSSLNNNTPLDNGKERDQYEKETNPWHRSSSVELIEPVWEEESSKGGDLLIQPLREESKGDLLIKPAKEEEKDYHLIKPDREKDSSKEIPLLSSLSSHEGQPLVLPVKELRLTRRDIAKFISRNTICLHCATYFEQSVTLFRHLINDHYYTDLDQMLVDMKVSAQCPSCTEIFMTRESLIYHLGLKHKKVKTFYFNWIKNNPDCIRKYAIKGISYVPIPVEESLVKENRGGDQWSTFSLFGDMSQEFAKISAILQFYLNKDPTSGPHSFIQPGACFFISPSLHHCHECENYVKDGMDGIFNSCCQFEGFRKLSIVEGGRIAVSGWLDPIADPKAEDKSLWTPVYDHMSNPPPTLDVCKFILKYVGSQFCELMREEMEAQKKYPSNRIWKRMQEGVREMCDVCSTTLFNTHYTCGECGILVCIDCFAVRSRGNVEYFGSNNLSKPYKSHRKILTKNRDEHMWPLCKKRLKHQVSSLLCTQIICHGLMESLYETFHSVCDQLGIRNCCLAECPREESNVTADTEASSEFGLEEEEEEEEVVVVPSSPSVKIEIEQTLPNDSEEVEGDLEEEEASSTEYKEVVEVKEERQKGDSVEEDSTYRECPICSTSFPSAVPTLGSIHLTRHFEEEIRSLLPKDNPNSCPQCPQTFEKEDLVILHLGIEHGVTNEKLSLWSKKRTIKVQLNVDSASNCIVCGMNFGYHMMGFPQIRSHLFLHFRPIIRSKFKLEGYCPLCPPVDTSIEPPRKISYLTKHIGIHHRYLDICWNKHLKREVKEEEDPKEEDPKEEDPKEEDPKEKDPKEEDPKEEDPKEKDPKEKDPKEEDLKDDSKEEKDPKPLEDVVNKRPPKTYRSVIMAFSCDICCARLPDQRSLFHHSALHHFKEDLLQYLTPSGTCSLCFKKNSSLLHVALDHGKIRELLSNEVSVLSKTPEKDGSGFPYCPVCQSDGNFELSHFSLHLGIPSHREVIWKDPILRKAVKRLNTVCILCEKRFRQNSLVSHYYSHFRKLLDFRVGSPCRLCQDSGLPPSPSAMEAQVHFRQEHFSDYLEGYLGPLRSSEDVERLRKTLSRKDTSREPLKLSCDYCTGGYSRGRYYEHMSLEHFQEVLRVGLPQEPPFTCDRCPFVGDSLSELIVHSADYHKNLDRILNYICPSFSEETSSTLKSSRLDLQTFKSTKVLNEKTQIFSCKRCSFMTMKEAALNTHIIQHIRELTTSFIGFKSPPYICPTCHYEASSYTSLLRHFCNTHTHLLESGEEPSLESKTKQEGKRRRSSSSKARLQVSVTYKEDTPLVRSPVKAASKKRDFASFIRDLAGETPALEEMSFVRPSFRALEEESRREERVMSKELSSKMYPSVDHDWYSDGRLLFLNDPSFPGNKALFQDQWARGQPVLVSNCSGGLSTKYWHPRAFLQDFGHLRHDLVNCFTGKVVPKAPLNAFWRGFERVEDRLRDEQGNPMLLKLKDWPPTLDIADYIPKRFGEFINSLIFPEYTRREGYLNLASYIPKFFLRPELGPKMYIAYGSALYSDKGSTNLHIDMSDAVNLLVHVGMAEDADHLENAKEVFKEIDEADCDVMMKWRIRNKGQLPGALWHIYHPSATNKIRSFLNKVALEKGKRLDPHDDPIHDQSHYLDGPMRLRLYEEYGVKGYGIVQCAGDTVFIPAGACHQVRNLNNCIKIAEDFVSPENTSHCLHLTQEFRHLTEFHTNHEDKLQIKNLMYHSIKASITVLKDHISSGRNDDDNERSQEQ